MILRGLPQRDFIIKASREALPTGVRRPEITYNLEFNLENDKSYFARENDHKIDVWASEGLVFAMVM
jgi:hypothetical protein